jgi:hypothetical protein
VPQGGTCPIGRLYQFELELIILLSYVCQIDMRLNPVMAMP